MARAPRAERHPCLIREHSQRPRLATPCQPDCVPVDRADLPAFDHIAALHLNDLPGASAEQRLAPGACLQHAKQAGAVGESALG